MPWAFVLRAFLRVPAFKDAIQAISFQRSIKIKDSNTFMQWPLLLVLCLNVFGACAKAQTTTTTLPNGDNPNQGLPSGGIFSAADIDSVQMASGNLHIEIPLWQVKGRGGLNFWVKLVYDNKGWDTKTQVVDHGPNGDPRYVTTYFIEPGPASNMKWSLVTPDSYATVDFLSAIVCSKTLTMPEFLAALIEPDGTTHTFNPTSNAANSCPGRSRPFTPYSTDATGWMRSVRKDGTKFSPTNEIADGEPGSMDGGITDRNGNTITYVAQSSIHTDTAGRTTGNVLTYHDSSGAPQTVNISYTSVSISTNFCGNRTLGISNRQCAEYSTSWNAPSSIRLPNGTSYTITYNQGTSGEIQSITLPSGAVIDYSWTPNVGGSVLDASGKRVSERDVHDGNSTYVWKYNYSDPNQVIFTDPNNDDTTYNCAFGASSSTTFNYVASTPCYPTDIKYYSGAYSSGAVKKEVLRTYWPTSFNNETVWGAERLVQSEHTLLDGIPVSRTDYDYDYQPDSFTSWGNIIDQREYLYVNGSWALARRTHTTYKHLDDPTNYGSRNLADLPSSVTTYDGGTPGAAGPLTNNYSGGNVIAQTIYGYDEYSTSPLVDTLGSAPQHDYADYPASMPYRGNLTSVQRWNSSNGGYETTRYTYNDLGDRLSTTDPNGHTTTYSYADSYSGSGCVSANAQAYLTLSTNALGQATSSSYYPCSGLLHGTKDPNDIANNRSGTQYSYDMEGWLTGTTFSDGGASTTTYNGYALPLVSTTTRIATPDPSTTTSVHYDFLGRPTQTILQSAPTSPVHVDTVYDGLGQIVGRSNPYRATADSTYGETLFSYDAIGRKQIETQPDGSTLQWSYSGNEATFTDEAGNQWTQTSDALGRLTNITEPGGLQTTYTYDALDNLRSATQAGISGETPRTRSFGYDSLSRLTSATNPETGTVGYTYDANGNVLTKTDARGVTTNYTYDALNRLTWKRYSDGSKIAGFGYDGNGENGAPFAPAQGNAIGRLSVESNEVDAATAYSYDSMGRIARLTYCLPSSTLGSCWSTVIQAHASYDLAGNMTSLTYPDGHHITQTWDSAGHLASSQLVDISGTSTNQSYLQSASYFPDGSPQVLTLGNGVQQIIGKNNRLQIQTMVASTPLPPFNSQQFLSHTYCYVNCTTGGVKDNGNIWGITDTLNASQTQGFTYDNLNRITSFSLGGTVAQQFRTDSFGNMSPMAGANPVYTFDPATNRINNLPCAASLASYDNGGNQTCDTDSNGALRTYSFDAENRIKQIAMAGNPPFETYTYDGDGNRVRKDNANGTYTEYVYFNGQPMAEHHSDGTWADYIYAGGQQIARSEGYDQRIHLHGTLCSGCTGSSGWNLPISGYVVKNLDKISWRQFQGPTAQGGIGILFTDGTYSNWVTEDTDGQVMNYDQTHETWHLRTVDLSAFAGKTINALWINTESPSAAGDWDEWFADISIYGTNGTVTPIYHRQPSIGLSYFGSGSTNLSATVEQSFYPTDAAMPGTTFFVRDHLGSASMEFAGGGWPVWKGQFAPFGQELDTQFTANHYKFTGKERDIESGNDYFGARYYSSTLGRWMSPDWANKPEAVPYSSLDNPQSLSLYGYEGDNPLAKADADGHCWPLCTIVAGAAVGALTGGAIEAGVEYISTGRVDIQKVENAALGGLVTGAIIGAAGPEAGLAARAGIGAVAGVTGGAAERGVDGENVGDGKAIAVDAIAGAISPKLEAIADKTFATEAIAKTVPKAVDATIDASRRIPREPLKSNSQSSAPKDKPVPITGTNSIQTHN